MNYPDGTAVEVGDFIWWNEGSRLGFVCKIIESLEDLDSWSFGLEGKPGILIGCGHPFNPENGGIIHPLDLFEDEGIGRLSAEETAEFERAFALASERSQVGFQHREWDVHPEVRDCALFVWDFTIFSCESTPDGRAKTLETIKILHSEVSSTSTGAA